jgi:hypothetical protein
MAALVYKRVRSHQWTEVWEQLAPTERDAFLTKLDQILKMSGGKRYVLLAYDTAQALQEWNTFGIEIFPICKHFTNTKTFLINLSLRNMFKPTPSQAKNSPRLG